MIVALLSPGSGAGRPVSETAPDLEVTAASRRRCGWFDLQGCLEVRLSITNKTAFGDCQER